VRGRTARTRTARAVAKKAVRRGGRR